MMFMQDVNWYRWLKIAIMVIVGIFSLSFLYSVRSVLMPFVIAALVAYILNPAVDYVQRWHLTRVQAIALVYAVLVVLGVVAGLYVIPLLVAEVNRLVRYIPGYISQIQETFSYLERVYAASAIPPSIRASLSQALQGFLGSLEQRLTGFLSKVLMGVGGIFSGLFSFILGNILAVYLLKDSPHFYRRFKMLLPRKRREPVLAFISDVDEVFSGFVHGRLIVSAVVGGATAVILGILGLRFYVILGLIAGLTNLIPYFGPFIGVIPAVTLAAFQSRAMVIQVVITYLLIQQLEEFIINPQILSRQTGLHPLGVVFAVMAGGSLFGLWGMFLGVPIGAALKVCLDHLTMWLKSG